MLGMFRNVAIHSQGTTFLDVLCTYGTLFVRVMYPGAWASLQTFELAWTKQQDEVPEPVE
jgi:hypothetical protein